MNFTRDPVIETVITPKEGCKLVIRNSKQNGGEDYFVDAVEVVSFGNFLFFRSLERPKSFLLPISDYEVLELKETKMVLKTASSEKSIKIGVTKKEDAAEDIEKVSDKKKRRSRKRKASSNHKKKIETETKLQEEETKKGSFTRLFPPPAVLIKEKLTKTKEKEIEKEDIFVQDIAEPAIDLQQEKEPLSGVLVDSKNQVESTQNQNNEENDVVE